MQMNKRCTNCSRFPFCDIHLEYCDKEKNWIKRERNLKLENTDKYNYDFEEIN
jgi:hypothetical protein